MVEWVVKFEEQTGECKMHACPSAGGAGLRVEVDHNGGFPGFSAATAKVEGGKVLWHSTRLELRTLPLAVRTVKFEEPVGKFRVFA